ncbi:germinal-center associated nuclear protein [Genypterus blacodes]|uniref:germinal-center associated nuclear protein n=1 Tax=Genypterus blacodes TaxID=154954 RepID=UPI003F767A52
MNQNNPFGSPQGGAFQSFGQQSASNPPQIAGFFQGFRQPSALNQPSPIGNAAFGQPPAFGQNSVFGQPSAEPPSLPAISQAPSFGQPSIGQSSSNFSSSAKPAFGQSGGQTPMFGQSSGFGQASGFAQQASVLGQQTGFGHSTGNAQLAPASTPALGAPTQLGFGQPLFGQPMSTTTASSTFGTAQSVTQSRGFGSTEFCFKPANEVTFKPIFSASPEPANPKAAAVSSSPFGIGAAQTSSSTVVSGSTTTTGFSLLPGTKPGPVGFSFSQPAAAPSGSVQKNPLTAGISTEPANTLQFTFSQPAAPSSSSSKTTTTQPTTPSSFSFSTKTAQPEKTNVFGKNPFGQTSVLGDAKVQKSTEEKGSNLNEAQGANVFAMRKPAKRKQDPTAISAGSEKPAEEEDASAGGRQPTKKQPIRPHGLFSRALNQMWKSNESGRREAVKENQQQAPDWGETESKDVQAQENYSTATPPRAQAPIREVLEKAEESDPAATPDLKLEATPSPRCDLRTKRTESLGGMSPSDCTVIQCKNVPPTYNKKEVIKRHFARFGRVSKVFCRPPNNLAIVHFEDHASAFKAKKKGKTLCGTELLILWQRKKQGERGKRLSEEKDQAEEEGQDTEPMPGPSLLRLPTFRSPGISSTATLHSSPVKNSPLARSQFDSELQQEGSGDTLSSERPVPSSLLHLVGLVAETAEDKYRLLEQRDKVLRQDRPKRTDLDLTRVFVGTCPDMCPEKERYMRETRKQLSTYEEFPDTEMVDHTAAIKEYSRSSADQEEPLPHELRPLPVLSMTMDYLVTQIMDLGHENYRDWYDFVWNRTRSIRKDITQQRLCCPHTVSLIEKCTRFHVHCGHHLCEEPMSSFDAKINDENMTKCMQSLKEMYQDLALCNVYCSREAEFRQYNVLLKLNDGDILREVQQFRDEVRNSPEVKFAVQAFAALNNNNFVRFFKLVKGASYLASCLLHRYFNQVRSKALKTLNLAHTFGYQRSTAFPVQDMVRMLMFRDEDEAADFIGQYGLNISDGMVELSRATYQEPQLPLPKKSDIILAKKTVLTGVVVNGGFLPKAPQHRPVCSFDSQNKYRGEGPLAEPTPSILKPPAYMAKAEVTAPPEVVPQGQPEKLLVEPGFFGQPQALPEPATPAVTVEETGETSLPPPPPYSAHLVGAQQLFQPIAQPQPVKPPPPPPKPEPTYTDEDILAVLDSVVEEVIKVAVTEVAGAAAAYAKTALAESSVQVDSVVNEVVGQLLQDMSSAEIKLEQQRVAEENRRVEEARRKQEREAFLAQFSLSLCAEVIQEVLAQSIQEVAASEFKEAVDEKAECVARCTEQVCMSLIEETLEAKISLLAEEILDVELQRIHKYIKRWRDVVAVRLQLRRQMRGFPAAPCCVDPRFRLKALAPSAPVPLSMADLACGWVDLGNSGRFAISSTRLLKTRQEVAHQLRVHFFYQQLLDESVWVPLDLPALVTEHVPDPPDRLFWKAVLLLPSDDESVASLADQILSDWLEVKFGADQESEVKLPDGTLQTLCVTNTVQENRRRTHKVHISVKASRGPLTDDSLSKVEECCELQGARALILLLPALFTMDAGQDKQDVPLLSALVQLKQLQQVSTWDCQLPLVILVPGSDDGDTRKLEEALMLPTLVKEGLISEYIFLFIPETISDLQGCKQLTSAMRWLLTRAPQNVQLSCQPLVQLVEASLNREFSSRLFAHRQERAGAGLPPQSPAPIIHLYNALMAHLADLVSSPELSMLSWPPQEFCSPDTRNFVPHLAWNSAEHLAWLREAILSLQLPQWKLPPTTDSWSELSASIFDYAAQVPVSQPSQVLLMSRLENLLEKVRLQHQPAKTHRALETLNSYDDWDQGTHPAFHQIPWDDLLMLCIDHKLKDSKIPGSPVCEDAVTEDGDILVYFPLMSVKDFQPPEEWSQAIRETHRGKQQETEGATCCAPPTSQSLIKRLFYNAELPGAQESLLCATDAPTQQEPPAHLKVLQSIEREKAQSQRCMEQFQRWMDTDPMDSLPTPCFLPSSTLLSMPSAMMSAVARTGDSSFSQEPDSEEMLGKAGESKITPVSMSQRLKELQRQILASQEEELAYGLQLNGLLSIVDD